MRKKFNEKSFFKSSLVLLGIVMIFYAVSSIILFYLGPLMPQRTESVVSNKNNVSMLTNMSALYEENPDIVGWIKIEGTVIDYPVMYTKDDGEFYLYRNFYKNKDVNGSIFLDEHCTMDPFSTNLLLHGHNMNNGSMFGALMKYKSQDFYNSHKRILFDTLYENQVYEIISVFKSKVYNVSDNVFKYYKFYNAKNKEEFKDFVDNIKRLSLYDTGVTARYGDKFITLSTCENSTPNGRFVVVAKKIKEVD